ncbi:MAG: hypothetical protein ACUVQZ_03580 [Candidatus Caldatribacteriaceae bacterium]
MTRIIISSLGGFAVAIIEIFLLWRDTQAIFRLRDYSSFRMLIRLSMSGAIILVLLRFLEINMVIFLLSFSVAYFSLIVWFGVERRDGNGRNI